MNTLLEFYNDQLPASDPRYRYGMVRTSAEQPDWIPYDAGLVDHLFLLFGLVESIDPTFFDNRVMPALLPGDYNFDGFVDAADYTLWRDTKGTSVALAADGNLSGFVNAADLTIWRNNFGRTRGGSGPSANGLVPEPSSVHFGLLAIANTWIVLWFSRWHS